MRCALVTGGTRGIGRAVCDMFADLGFSLAVAYNKNEDIALDMIRGYQDKGINCIAVKADLSKKGGADRLIEQLVGFPKIDTLVNNAGTASFGRIQDMTDEEIEWVMTLNFYSPLKLIRELSKDMISRGFGRIVNITSMWGAVGASCESVYAASKAALTGLSKSLAKEFAKSNVTVNCVAPGLIDTDMNRNIDKNAIAEIVNATPLARMGKPEDVAAAVELLTRQDLFITGETINVNGGYII